MDVSVSKECSQKRSSVMKGCRYDIGVQLYKAACAGKTDLMKNKTGFRKYSNSKYGDLQEAPLHAAIRNGHLAAAEKLVELGVREDIVDSEGNYPLHLAAARCDIRLVKLLQNSLNNPRIINQVNTEGDTPIFCAFNSIDAYTDSCSECIKELLAHNANVNTPGKCGYLPIELVVDFEELRLHCDLFILLAPKTMSLKIIKRILESILREDLEVTEQAYVMTAALSVIPNVWDVFVKIEENKFDLSDKERRFRELLHIIFAVYRENNEISVLVLVAKFGTDAAFLIKLKNTKDENLASQDEDEYTVFFAIENSNLLDSTVCILLQRIKWSIEEYSSEQTMYHAIENKRNEVVDYLINSCPALVSKSYGEDKLFPLFHYLEVGTSPDTLRRMLHVTDRDIIQEQLEKKILVYFCFNNVSELRIPFLSILLEFDRKSVIQSMGVPFINSGHSGLLESVLHKAVQQGDIAMCEFLLSTKPELANMADEFGMLPLAYAMEEQSDEMVLMLLQHTPDPNNFTSKLHLHICQALNNSRLSHVTIEQLFLKGLRCCDGDSKEKCPNPIKQENQWLSRWCTCVWQDSERPSSPSHEAAAAGRNTELQRLAGAGATEWCLVDSMHRTVLHVAIQNSDVTLETIKILVGNGALVNRVGGPSMQTPLHVALSAGRPEVCRYLLTQGAEPCIADAKFKSPIHDAIQNGMWEMVRLMISTTQDLGKCNMKGYTILTTVIRHINAPYDLIETLINLGADVNFHTSQYNRPGLDEFAEEEFLSEKLPGLLHIAVRMKHVKPVKLLCTKNVSKLAAFSSIHLMVSLEDAEFAAEVLPDLLRSGENINSNNKFLEFGTPLELAIDLGLVKMLELLINFGAKLELSRYRMPLEAVILSERFSPEVVLALLQNGADVRSEFVNIISLCNQKISEYRYRFQLVCVFAIHFGIIIRNVHLESDEFQADVGVIIQTELLATNQCPRSLALQCRDLIRKQCQHWGGCEPYRCVGAALDALPAPERIKAFLRMQDVNLEDIRATLAVNVEVPEEEEEEDEPCNDYLSMYDLYLCQLHQDDSD